MRTTTLICTFFLLSSCGGGPKPQETVVHILGNSDESSPIIISDGSIRIRQKQNKIDHFRIHGAKKASIKQSAYQPYYLGFGCSAPVIGPSDCNSVCNQASIQSKCKIDVSPSVAKMWILSLCDSADPCVDPGTVQFQWIGTGNNSDSEKIDIKSYDQPLKVYDPTGSDGVGLKHTGANPLRSATLTVTDTNGALLPPYKFTCQQNQDCLTLSYECHVSGNLICGK